MGRGVDIPRHVPTFDERRRCHWPPCHVRSDRPLGTEGDGALTLMGERGPVVVPARWRADEHALFAALPEETLALAVAGPGVCRRRSPSTRPSAWRARDMVGAMVQGTA